MKSSSELFAEAKAVDVVLEELWSDYLHNGVSNDEQRAEKEVESKRLWEEARAALEAEERAARAHQPTNY